MRKWPVVQNSKGRWWCGFFFRRSIYDRIAGNIAKRYFAKRYLRASFIQINRRSSRCRSLFQLDDDEIIDTLAPFVVPDFAALQTPAIQRDGACMRFWIAGTYDLRHAASGEFPIYRVRNYILKVIVAVSGRRPNALIFCGDNLISHR
jgi:hypothetical protein